MNTKKVLCAVILSILFAGLSAGAAEGKGKKGKSGKDDDNSQSEKSGDSKKESSGKGAFSDAEKNAIHEYVKSFDEPSGKKGKKGKPLPPGLQKKLARGGSLPPGWEEKVVKTEIMPVEVFKECHPLPPEIVVKLPPPPQGIITVTISGKVVRLLEATREILDVFEVGR